MTINMALLCFPLVYKIQLHDAINSLSLGQLTKLRNGIQTQATPYNQVEIYLENKLHSSLKLFFRDSVAHATISCQLSLFAWAEMTQETLRRNENHFSTWKALNHFDN